MEEKTILFLIRLTCEASKPKESQLMIITFSCSGGVALKTAGPIHATNGLTLLWPDPHE